MFAQNVCTWLGGGQVTPDTGTAIPNHSCCLVRPGFGVAQGLWAVLRWEVALPGSGLGCWSLLPGWTRLCCSLRSAQCFLAVLSMGFSVGFFQMCFQELSKCVPGKCNGFYVPHSLKCFCKSHHKHMHSIQLFSINRQAWKGVVLLWSVMGNRESVLLSLRVDLQHLLYHTQVGE